MSLPTVARNIVRAATILVAAVLFVSLDHTSTANAGVPEKPLSATALAASGVQVLERRDYLVIAVDADRYEGFALDQVGTAHAGWLQIDPSTTVGCGREEGEEVDTCQRRAYLSLTNGVRPSDGEQTHLHLYAGSIRQSTVELQLLVGVRHGKLELIEARTWRAASSR